MEIFMKNIRISEEFLYFRLQKETILKNILQVAQGIKECDDTREKGAGQGETFLKLERGIDSDFHVKM